MGVSIGLVNKEQKEVEGKYYSRQKGISLSGICPTIAVTLFNGFSMVAL